jgi:hypothetical protein
MTKRPNDNTPPPPGGRAAERLREFEAARGITPLEPTTQETPEAAQTEAAPEPVPEKTSDPEGRTRCSGQPPPSS